MAQRNKIYQALASKISLIIQSFYIILFWKVWWHCWRTMKSVRRETCLPLSRLVFWWVLKCWNTKNVNRWHIVLCCIWVTFQIGSYLYFFFFFFVHRNSLASRWQNSRYRSNVCGTQKQGSLRTVLVRKSLCRIMEMMTTMQSETSAGASTHCLSHFCPRLTAEGHWCSNHSSWLPWSL